RWRWDSCSPAKLSLWYNRCKMAARAGCRKAPRPVPCPAARAEARRGRHRPSPTARHGAGGGGGRGWSECPVSECPVSVRVPVRVYVRLRVPVPGSPQRSGMRTGAGRSGLTRRRAGKARLSWRGGTGALKVNGPAGEAGVAVIWRLYVVAWPPNSWTATVYVPAATVAWTVSFDPGLRLAATVPASPVRYRPRESPSNRKRSRSPPDPLTLAVTTLGTG